MRPARCPADLAPRRWLPGLPGLVLLAACRAVSASPEISSPDGHHRLHADASRLTVEDAAGRALKQWPLRDRAGQPVRVQALVHHAGRQTFVVALAGAQELWLISHDPAALPFFNGWVHDYRMGEGLAEPGTLGLQRVLLKQAFSALWVDARVPWLLGQAGPPEAPQAVVLHLDIRREIAVLPLPGPLAAATLRADASGQGWQLALPGPGGEWLHDTRRWRGQWVSAPAGP